jgi:hypothetical protein
MKHEKRNTMKTKTTLTAILIAGLSFGQQAAIVNGFEGFETWVNAEVGELPQHWDGFNKNITFSGNTVGSVTCVEKDASDPYEGVFSAKLTSTSVMGGPAVPGMLTVGDLVIDWNAQDGDVIGGEAYTQLPQELYGQFKYTPVGIDTGFVSVWFLENGEEVGQGYFEFTTSTAGWTAFSTTITYEPGAAPDSMNVLFASSTSASNAPEGTVLEIDAIGFGSYLSSASVEAENIQLFPNPTSDTFRVRLQHKIEEPLQLVDANGVIVRTIEMNGLPKEVDVSNLASGVYYVRFGNMVSEKLVIQ